MPRKRTATRKRKHSDQRQTRLRSLAVLSQMRHGKSLAQAARLEHTTPRTVQRQLGKQLKRTRSGRYSASRADTLRRDLNILGREGYMPVMVRSSRQAELASQHLIAVNKFMSGGDAAVLKPFTGRRIAGVELLTDPDRLLEFADAGAVKLDALYRQSSRVEG